MDLSSVQEKKIETIFKGRNAKLEGNYSYNAVMVLLFPIQNELHILYSQRALHLENQPGDICFPGGRAEKNETPLDTALRETYEEIGISKDQIKVLGALDYIVTPFGKVITPYLGIVHDIKVENIKFSTDEVEKIFTVPLRFFDENLPIESYIYYEPSMPEDFPFDLIEKGKDYRFGVTKYKELFYKYNDNIIWGLTARITNNVCQIIKSN